jgi:cell division initiation protein
MIDLTPLDVRKKRGDFRRIFRGYDPEEVDSFLELVGERLEELVKNNLVLLERTERLERSLTALEQREDAVQDALVTAQRLRTEVQEQSRRDAEILKDQTRREAQLLRAEAEAEIANRLGQVEKLLLDGRRSLEDLERSRRKFLKAFRGLLERELDTVEVEEARAPLEEIPMELEFRGWIPEGGYPSQGEGGIQEAPPEGTRVAGWEDSSEVVGEGPFAAPEEEFRALPEGEPEQAGGEERLEAADAESPGIPREERLEAADAESPGIPREERPKAPGEDSPEVERGERADPAPDSRSATEVGVEGSPEARSSLPGGQPKWLFSLLKRDDQGERKEDA